MQFNIIYSHTNKFIQQVNNGRKWKETNRDDRVDNYLKIKEKPHAKKSASKQFVLCVKKNDTLFLCFCP